MNYLNSFQQTLKQRKGNCLNENKSENQTEHSLVSQSFNNNVRIVNNN